MFKAIFGVLGLIIGLAIVVPLAKPHLGAFLQGGQTTTRIRSPTAAGADKTSAAQPASGAQKSMFERTDDAWRQSKERYER
jgi:hypothetical protein